LSQPNTQKIFFKYLKNLKENNKSKAYPAEKEYLETEGGHNTPRLEEYYETVSNH